MYTIFSNIHLLTCLCIVLGMKQQKIGGVQLPAVSFQKVFASTGASVTFTEAIVNSSLTVDVGSVEFDVAADTLKLTIEVSNWARESEGMVHQSGVVWCKCFLNNCGV